MTVPICLRVVQTLAHGDGSKTLGVDIIEHVSSEIHSGQLVDIVSYRKSIAVIGSLVAAINALFEIVLCDLDFFGSKLVVVCR